MDFSAGMDEQVTRGETTSIEVRIGDDEIIRRRVGDRNRIGRRIGADHRAAHVPIRLQVRKARSGSRSNRRQEKPIVRYFDVTATDLGKGHIDIVFRQGQVPILTLTLEPEVVAGAPEATRRDARFRFGDCGSSARRAAASAQDQRTDERRPDRLRLRLRV